MFDIFFASIAPAMFGFIAAMVMLEEHDDHIDRYLFITGLGRKGYLVSRIVIPALGAFVITAALLPVFRLSALSAAGIVLPSFWIGKAVLESALIWMFPAVFVAGIWILVLLRVFSRKL